MTIDIMPTLLSIVGTKPDKSLPLDGVDLSSALFERRALPPRPLFWASLSNRGLRSEAMREGPWKLVVQHPKSKPGTFGNERVSLFRLDRDLGEKRDLAADEPDQTQLMLKRLKAWYSDTQRTARKQPGGWLSRPSGGQ